MIYENFINCRVSKEELYKLFEDSYIFESLIMLKNFNYEKIIFSKDIIENTNNFIEFFGGDLCKNDDDIIKFYENWQKYFKEKSEEYLKEAYKVLNDIYEAVKENKENKIHPINVKEMLYNIYIKYIK